MINANDAFTLDLSLFAGKVSDMAPGNIPAGASPGCLDMWFGGQYTATRPAWLHALPNAFGSGDILSHLDYPQPTGETNLIALYSDGSLWQNNVQDGTYQKLGWVSPGVRFKAVAAFDKFFMAYRGLELTSPFTDAQLAGGDVPRYLNTLGHLWRVTSDAPGGGYSVTGAIIGPEAVVTPSNFVIGPAITAIGYSVSGFNGS